MAPTGRVLEMLSEEREIPWRGTVASLNYILTSSGWRQEHNGFSHQNPGFIDDMLQRQGGFIHVYFPPDGNCALAVLDRCLASERGINIIVACRIKALAKSNASRVSISVSIAVPCFPGAREKFRALKNPA
jgi:phosphoketolase